MLKFSPCQKPQHLSSALTAIFNLITLFCMHDRRYTRTLGLLHAINNQDIFAIDFVSHYYYQVFCKVLNTLQIPLLACLHSSHLLMRLTLNDANADWLACQV